MLRTSIHSVVPERKHFPNKQGCGPDAPRQRMQEKSSVNLMKGLIISDKCSWSPKSWMCCAILSKFHPSLLTHNSYPSITLPSKDLHPTESALWLACLQITTVDVNCRYHQHPFLHRNCQHTNTHIHLFSIWSRKERQSCVVLSQSACQI